MTADRSVVRPSVAETLLSVGLVAWGLSEAIALPSSTPLGVRIVFVLLATVPLAWRNRHPELVMAWSLGILVVQELLDVLSGLGVTPYQCICLATYALAASERSRPLGGLGASALVVLFPSFLYLMDTDGSYQPVNAIGTALIQLTVVVAGRMVRARRIEARKADEMLQDEARSAPARLAAAVAAEQETIAAELQALIASDLTEMERLLGQASGALADGDAVRAGGLAAAVQATAARAVAEMRRLLLALGGEVDDRAIDERAHGGLAHPRGLGDRAQWWRDRAADAAVVLPLVVLLAAEIDKLDAHQPLAAFVGAALLLAPAAARRRWPLAAALVISVGMVTREVVGLLPPLPVSLLPMLIVPAYAASAFSMTSRRAVLGVAATALGGLVLVLLQLDEGGAWPDVPVVLFVVGCAFAAGELVRDNDGRILTLRAGTARLAAEHRQRRADALEGERRRAARELHDVVAHGVSLVAVQAGAAAAIVERDPTGAARAVALAREAAAHTRADLGRLADAIGVGTQAPPPGATDLGTLVESARRSGQTVALRVDGALDALPADAGVSLYRIVQETLTNARKHAPPGAETSVRVTVDPDAVELRVSTAQAGVAVRRSGEGRGAALPGSGHGIAGMRERARLLGGELEAGPSADGAFVVTARLPRLGGGRGRFADRTVVVGRAPRARPPQVGGGESGGRDEQRAAGEHHRQVHRREADGPRGEDERGDGARHHTRAPRGDPDEQRPDDEAEHRGAAEHGGDGGVARGVGDGDARLAAQLLGEREVVRVGDEQARHGGSADDDEDPADPQPPATGAAEHADQREGAGREQGVGEVQDDGRDLCLAGARRERVVVGARRLLGLPGREREAGEEQAGACEIERRCGTAPGACLVDHAAEGTSGVRPRNRPGGAFRHTGWWLGRRWRPPPRWSRAPPGGRARAATGPDYETALPSTPAGRAGRRADRRPRRGDGRSCT